MTAPTLIPTVRGPVSPDDLGWILPHEHVVTSGAGIWSTYPELLGDRASLEAEALSALTSLKDTPFRTIVDLSTHDLGRNVHFLRRMSLDSGIHIVVATGCWIDIPRSFYRRTSSEVAALFARELCTGIDGTDIRAGVIKVASEGTISLHERIIFAAAVQASVETGAAIYTHSDARSRGGLEQLDILIRDGADPRRVCIGHTNDSVDIAYIYQLLDRGCFVGLDRLPGDIGAPLDGRIDLIVQLVARGYASRILLSHDWAVEFSHSFPPRAGRERNPERYRLISDIVLPQLLQQGVTESDIAMICGTNPRQFLTWSETT